MSDNSLSVKYRPRKLEDVIGQQVPITSITNAFKNKTLHHALIFAGKYGCGKTSMARLLAAMENCEKGASLEPCGECGNCRSIFSGESTDIKELDVASNGGIDDIRAIAKEIKYAPLSCKVKYVIFDEAHRLTDASAEAALKMIEEPPENVRFILCTTDPHLLKDTIHSRCITLKFHQVGWNEMFLNLEKVVKQEKIEIEDTALKLAARYADGSVRNSLVNLQSLVNFAGERKITVDDAKKVLGAVDDIMFFKLIDAVIGPNIVSGVKIISELLRDGRDYVQVTNALFGHLRNLMLFKTCRGEETFGLMPDEVKAFKEQAAKIFIESIIDIIALLTNANTNVRVNLDPQFTLETFLINAVIAHNKVAANKKKKEADNKEKPKVAS